ncbi:MAG: hypothetical protein ABSF71_28710, partial [Terriglobia bacterium]
MAHICSVTIILQIILQSVNWTSASPAASESPRREPLGLGLGCVGGLIAVAQPAGVYFPSAYFRG